MNVRAWRLTKPRHAASAFDGEGPRLYGGRWNSPGTRVVYLSDSIALAALELLVHLESSQLLNAYTLFEAGLDDSLVETLDPTSLPANWRDDPSPLDTQAIGDGWVAELSAPALRVPSVLVPEESNLLLNPAHARFEEVARRPVRDFQFDARFAKPRG